MERVVGAPIQRIAFYPRDKVAEAFGNFLVASLWNVDKVLGLPDFADRVNVENDVDLVQPVSIVAIVDPFCHGILTVRKDADSGVESGKDLLYCGGHVEVVDFDHRTCHDLTDVALRTAGREIREELGLDWRELGFSSIEPIAIWDVSGPVRSQQHFAIVHFMEIDASSCDIGQLGGDLTGATVELRKFSQCDVDSLEPWSRTIHDYVDGSYGS